jgi:hypothetical protein
MPLIKRTHEIYYRYYEFDAGQLISREFYQGFCRDTAKTFKNLIYSWLPMNLRTLSINSAFGEDGASLAIINDGHNPLALKIRERVINRRASDDRWGIIRSEVETGYESEYTGRIAKVEITESEVSFSMEIGVDSVALGRVPSQIFSRAISPELVLPDSGNSQH